MASPALGGALGLAPHLRRFGARRREDQQEDLAGAIASTLAAPILARREVARRDPAQMAGALQRRADRLGDRPVLARMADEDVVRHPQSPRGLP